MPADETINRDKRNIVGAISDTADRLIRADPSTHALLAMAYEHHEMHAGSHFFIKRVADVSGSDTVVETIFTTPDSDLQIHAKAVLYAEAEFLVEIFEGVAVSANGTPCVAFNNNRNSTKTPQLQCFDAPTVTDDGTLMWAAKVGSGRSDTGVSPGFNYEIIVKPNTTYMFRITKATSGTHWIDTDFFWYEHTPKN